MNSDFEDFIKEVQREVPHSIPSLMSRAQGILDANEIDAKIIDMQLSGSFASGNKKKPTEDSDIDLLISYAGSADSNTVVEKLLNKLHGPYEAYDIQAKRLDMKNKDLLESLPQKFIAEVFQEDGEGGMGGGVPAASVSANPANLSTGSSSTLSKMAPEHMRFGVVTPFGNVSRKKKKGKKKGWPYN